MTSQLNERSLRPMVLRDLIHPIISVDEYTPKLDDDNIVVLFQVLDNFDAAYDLSSFIERSPENVLDTEASGTPNVDGRYNVFVEFERNGEFPLKLITIIKDIENICPNPGWKLQLYKINDPVDLDVDLMQKNLLLSTEEELKEFFDYAPVQFNLITENKKIIGLKFNSVYGIDLNYNYTSGIMSDDEIFKKIIKEGYKLDTSRLSDVLGQDEYIVLCVGKEYIVGRDGKFIVLR